MRDPPAENIRGTKASTHHVEHSIDWGHFALGIGGLVLAYVIWRAIEPTDDGGEDDESVISRAT
jgi:hypothetical protein